MSKQLTNSAEAWRWSRRCRICERAARELDLQMALGPALFTTKSYSHPDIGRTYARAWELCRQLDDYSREFTALRGLHLYHVNLLEMEKAQHFAEEALRMAERLDDAARLVGAHTMLGHTLSSVGSSSRRVLTRGRASSCSIRTCSSRTGRVPTPACHAKASRRRFPGCSVTRIGRPMNSGQR